MTPIPAHFQLDATPVADPAAVVTAGAARFTVLTPRLLRLELSPTRRFCDRPSQPFWYRRQPVPRFETWEENGRLLLETEGLRLSWQRDAADFTAESLTITLLETGHTWQYGDPDRGNLRGTCRTLDGASGAVTLEPGLLSRDGWTVVDDSATLVFDQRGWLQPREPAGNRDLYFFGHGRDYAGALADYARISGTAPLLPRWALGNWWSRYWAYDEASLQGLIGEFQAHKVPLSVCIIDMDWHIVDTGRAYGGWTGYTWNRDLFPDPARMIAWLHDQGLRTALNLHPADGVRPHETQYPAVARRLGVDPASEEPIPFRLADPAFASAYFEELHHPEEARGVDFWWIDWQQGEESGLAGLDPLWWLNHLHFLDHGRDGVRRPFIFSRWGGLGNQRYPIGFSGDTYVTWASLAFQPYFTATAANVGYGWWSHDIGGHCFGTEEGELYARWVQFGAFSPILRLHSTNNDIHDRRPWAFDAEADAAAREALRLRHALIPYLYTMSWRNWRTARVPVRPMYHDYPDEDAAYHCPQQTTFGSELLVAPFVERQEPTTRMSRQVVWLPPGDWYDFFDGTYFKGGGWQVVYGDLHRVPVFARAGAILPLGPRVAWGGVEPPEVVDLHLFAGADGEFTLFEDDGESTAYGRGEYALTTIRLASGADRIGVTIEAVEGERRHVPAGRAYRLIFHAVADPDEWRVAVDGAAVDVAGKYDARLEQLTLDPVPLPAAAALTCTLAAGGGPLLARRDRTAERLTAMVRRFHLDTATKTALLREVDRLGEQPQLLDRYAITLSLAQRQALLEVALQAGVHHVQLGDVEELLLWNNRESDRVTSRFTVWDPHGWRHDGRTQGVRGVLPPFQVQVPPAGGAWELVVDYAGVVTVTLSGS